jgi:hypothetical protein
MLQNPLPDSMMRLRDIVREIKDAINEEAKGLASGFKKSATLEAPG